MINIVFEGIKVEEVALAILPNGKVFEYNNKVYICLRDIDQIIRVDADKMWVYIVSESKLLTLPKNVKVREMRATLKVAYIQ